MHANRYLAESTHVEMQLIDNYLKIFETLKMMGVMKIYDAHHFEEYRSDQQVTPVPSTGRCNPPFVLSIRTATPKPRPQ